MEKRVPWARTGAKFKLKYKNRWKKQQTREDVNWRGTLCEKSYCNRWLEKSKMHLNFCDKIIDSWGEKRGFVFCLSQRVALILVGIDQSHGFVIIFHFVFCLRAFQFVSDIFVSRQAKWANETRPTRVQIRLTQLPNRFENWFQTKQFIFNATLQIVIRVVHSDWTFRLNWNVVYCSVAFYYFQLKKNCSHFCSIKWTRKKKHFYCCWFDGLWM